MFFAIQIHENLVMFSTGVPVVNVTFSCHFFCSTATVPTSIGGCPTELCSTMLRVLDAASRIRQYLFTGIQNERKTSTDRAIPYLPGTQLPDLSTFVGNSRDTRRQCLRVSLEFPTTVGLQSEMFSFWNFSPMNSLHTRHHFP